MFNFFSKPKEPAKLCFATDIHCHIVPGVDDGSPDARTSADLVERMQAWGIERIIASPHVTQHTFENNPERLAAPFKTLQDELASRGNGIAVSHSAEYRIDDLFLQQLDEGKIMPYPNGWLLVENSFMQEPWNLEQVLFDLQVRGFRPILAHPERYTYYHSDKQRYHKLHGAGAAFQVNLLSLAGHYGKAERAVAEYLIKEGLVDFIGTDLHRSSHADRIDQYLATRQAAKDMEALAGKIKNDTAFV